MTQQKEPILKVENFNVEFWVDGVWYPAAIDMNYEVAAGEVLAIVGEVGKRVAEQATASRFVLGA